jgi:thioredoxin-like negative regulator of GroEL
VERRIQAHAHYATGIVAEMNDDPVQAAAEFKQAGLLEAGNAELVMEISRLLLRYKDVEGAREVLEKACERRHLRRAMPSWISGTG